jgi:hypothetical protein
VVLSDRRRLAGDNFCEFRRRQILKPQVLH